MSKTTGIIGRRHRLVEHREKIKSILHDENTYSDDISEFTASGEDVILNDGNNKEEGKGEELEMSFISRLLKKKKKGLLQKKLGRDIARINQRTANKKKVDNRTGGKKIKIQSPSHKKKKNKKSMTKEKPMTQKKKKEERWGAGNHNKWSVSWSSKSGKRSKGGKGGWGDDCTCIKWGDEWYSASKSAKTKFNKNHQCKKWKCNNGWGKWSSSKDGGRWNPTLSPSLSPTWEYDDDWYWHSTWKPTHKPASSQSPSSSPSKSPTMSPTKAPTKGPTVSPSTEPTSSPSQSPTEGPTSSPSRSPSKVTTSSTVASSTSEGSTTSSTEYTTSTSMSDTTTVVTTSQTTTVVTTTTVPSTSPSRSPSTAPSMSPTTSPSSGPTSITTISGTFYTDQNNNRIIDTGEGIENRKVELVSVGETSNVQGERLLEDMIVQETITDEEGGYEFVVTSSDNGIYKVRFYPSDPECCSPSRPGPENDIISGQQCASYYEIGNDTNDTSPNLFTGLEPQYDGTVFDVFPGSPSIDNFERLAFKGNYAKDDVSQTGVFYRVVDPRSSNDQIYVVANSETEIPIPNDECQTVTFGSTSPPSIANNKMIFLGLDIEESPKCGGIYEAELDSSNFPTLNSLVNFETIVPGEDEEESTFTAFGEGLSYDGSSVSFWGGWGDELEVISLCCPTSGNKARIAYCLNNDTNTQCDQYAPDGCASTCYQNKTVPVHQGIFIYNEGRITAAAKGSTANGTDFIFWNYSGKPPNTGPGEDTHSQRRRLDTDANETDAAEPPRWRASATSALSQYDRIAYKMKQDDVVGIYQWYEEEGTNSRRAIVETGEDCTTFDPSAVGLDDVPYAVESVAMERDSFRGTRLVVSIACASEEVEQVDDAGDDHGDDDDIEGDWGGIYMTRVCPLLET